MFIDVRIILKHIRIFKGLNQEAVAKKIGVSKSTVVGRENDFKYPSVANLIKLATLYHVPLNLLVDKTVLL